MPWMWVDRSPKTSRRARSLALWSGIGGSVAFSTGLFLEQQVDLMESGVIVALAGTFSAIFWGQAVGFREAHHRLKDQGK